jgi:hypothetical protein
MLILKERVLPIPGHPRISFFLHSSDAGATAEAFEDRDAPLPALALLGEKAPLPPPLPKCSWRSKSSKKRRSGDKRR